MAGRRAFIVLIVAGALASLGAQQVAAAGYRTQNFVVEAPNQQVAQQIAQQAEFYRRQKALEWLGQEMPPWQEPCPVRVTLTMNGSGGATTFNFDRGRILSQEMHIEGTLERLLASVLPHEVTHTVFAYRFRSPVPRWADEGGSVLSEDDIERHRHEVEVRRVLNTPGRTIPLRRLLQLTRYPPDVMVLYAEGYSVTSFLVNRGGRGLFLDFVARGMWGDWDGALRTCYQINSVEDLEREWVQSLRTTKPQPPTVLASNGAQGQGGQDTNRVVVRTTAPPAQPFQEAPRMVARGQAGEELPAAPVPADGAWYPASGTRLGAPQFDPGPNQPTLGQSPGAKLCQPIFPTATPQQQQQQWRP
jgi:hypothetical protein